MAILDVDGLIRELGPAAVTSLIEWSKWDEPALQAVQIQGSGSRLLALKRWLRFYAVFQGFTGAQRDAVCEAILAWSDNQGFETRLESLELLLAAHADLEKACVVAFGKERDFASLVSKALWLRYPEDVPIYDNFARHALQVISKVEPDLPAIGNGESGYAPFAKIWRTLYDRYSSALKAIPNGGYPYRVRIFDWILWTVGSPNYRSAALTTTPESVLLNK